MHLCVQYEYYLRCVSVLPLRLVEKIPLYDMPVSQCHGS